MALEKDKYNDIGPGGKSEWNIPTPGKKYGSFMITGSIFDHVTSGIGKGLYVYAYQHDSDKNLIFRKRSACKSDGSFNIQFHENELIINENPEIKNPIELFVYQGGTQLGLIGDGNVYITPLQPLYLKNLFIASKSSVSGVVTRKNHIKAAGCLVELYDYRTPDPESSVLIENASAFTNLKGEYKISFTGNASNILRLKFYNNEDITVSERVAAALEVAPIGGIPDEDLPEDETTLQGELIEDTENGKIYKVVEINEILKKRLVYWNDESIPGQKSLWEYIEHEGSNYQVLDRRVIYNPNGKSRECFTRVPEPFNPANPTKLDKVTETYKGYWSPAIATSNQKKDVNYMFKKNTLDDYTRLINHEEEFIPAKTSTDSNTPTRSMLTGYSIEDIPYVASVIGAMEDDVQDLSEARDFKSQLRLDDHEAIFYGLIKKGVHLDIANLFSISETTLKHKVQMAVEDGLIPEIIDLQSYFDEIRTRLIEILAEDYVEIFKEVSDNTIQSISADKKNTFLKRVAEYSYHNKPLDADFWNNQNLSDSEKSGLKLAIQYNEVCNGNEFFINSFVDSGSLQEISTLQDMTLSEIEAKITPEALASDDMPEGIVTANEYAIFIYNKIEELFATESLFYDLAKTNISIQADSDYTTKYNILRTKLISNTQASPTHFFDILSAAKLAFNIEKGPVRDFLETNAVNSELTSFYIDIAVSLGIDELHDTNEEKTAKGKKEWINFMTLIQRVYSVTKEGKFETIKALISKAYLSAYDIVKAGRSKFIEKMNGELTESKCIEIYKAAEYKVNKALTILNKYSGSSNSGKPIVISDKKIEDSDKETIRLLSLPEMSILFGDQDVTDTKHCESVLGPAAYLVDVLNVLKQFTVTESKESLYDQLIKRRPDIAEIPLNCANAVTPMPYIDLVMEVLENAIYYIENGNYQVSKWDTRKTEEQLKTDPEYTQYEVYDSIKKNSISSWLSKPFDLFSEELKLFGKTLGINRTKLAEPYSNLNSVSNPYFDVLGLTCEEQVLFPETSAETNAALHFTFDSIFGRNPDSVTKLPIKEFLEESVMTLDEFKALIGSYYVNPYVSDGNEYQRFTIHYDGKQELNTAYLDFGLELRLKAFLMRMFQFRRLMMLTEWPVSVLDAILLSNSEYKAYYNTANSHNNLITSDAVERIGHAKMNQEYLGMSNDQLAGVFGKAAVLEYEKVTSFVNRYFIDNGLSEEHKETFKEWLCIGDNSGAPENTLAYIAEGEPHVFMEYLQDAMNLDEDELLALSSLLESDNNAPKLTAKGIQNMITGWQLADAYGLKTDEFVNYCQFIGFDTTNQLVDSIDALTKAQHIVIANQGNLLDFLFLLQHRGSEKELQKFEDRTVKIVKNILDKKDELTPELEEGNIELTQKQKEDQAIALKPVIEEQLKLTTSFELSFVSEVLAQKSIEGKEIATYVTDPGADLPSDTKNKLTVVIKHCLKGLSLCELMGIEESELSDISSSPVDIFNLPLDEAQAVSFQNFCNLFALCQSGEYIIKSENPKQNRFTFYKEILDTPKESFPLSNYIDWNTTADANNSFLDIWKHNEESDPGNDTFYNKNLNWFIQAAEISQFLNKYGISSLEALQLIKWNWNSVSEAETSVKNITAIAKSKANAQIYRAEMTVGRNKLRMKQRDALVNYLLEINEEQFTDIYDLYSYFLIDTQMTSAVSSSRILQATLAIQSFIQRIQLGLETNITFTKKDAKKWEWMSLYRIWEANRKIFLYPENWLEPELRDNKTPFFKELEKELTGKEITKESIESSYMDYISKFEQVANIEICQMYNEEHDNFSVLHVIGRSRFEPHEYFYRKLLNESYWTPWEKMGIEINSEHIAPAIIKDRLVAFWLECTDVAKKPSKSDLSVKNPSEGATIQPKSAESQLQIQICWSELIDNKWTRKRSYENKLLINETNTNQKYDFRLVYDKGDTNYLHILNSPKSYLGDNTGFTYSVECFNHIHLTKLNSFKGEGYVVPQDMNTFGQKAAMSNSKEWLALPVAATNGIAYTNNIVENSKGNTRLVYPHQYKHFMCNAPFVVEANMQSVVFIPTIKAERSSALQQKVTRTIYTKPKYRSRKIYYRRDRFYPYTDEPGYHDSYGYRDEPEYYGRNGYRDDYNYHERYREERYRRHRLPPFFTYEHEEMYIVEEATIQTITSNEPVHKNLLIGKPSVFKPEMIAGLAYHPYMETLRSNLQRYGIDGILDPLGIEDQNHQLLPQQANKNYLRDFELNNEVVKNVLEDTNPEDNKKYITEQFDYDSSGAYSLYNWELFFHIPFLLANRFLIEGNYAEALRWMHYIFDPRETEGENVSRYWKFKPFADYNSSFGIDDLLFDLNMNGADDPANVELNKQIELWSNDPFKPHNIAQIRHGAYMKAVIMRYLDIIIAHGDDLFRTDTTESINEAIQYYMIAAQILGRKPEVVETKILAAKTYSEMNSGSMANAIEYFEEGLIKPENAAYLEKFVESGELEVASKPFSKDKNKKDLLIDIYGAMENEDEVAKLYFGIPKNDKMLAYWDRVADRLFKIRHSLNIDGIKRTLALFAPPIDPALLIRARLAGISIGEVMKQKDANPTEYRFQTLLQRALEICGEVKSLGSQLLSALEKGDTEKISLLRARHEKTLTELVTSIKEKNVEEAEKAIEQLKLQQENTQFRENYYRKKKKISGKEQQQLNYMDAGMVLQTASQALQMSAGAVSAIPDITFGGSGFGGSPHWVVTIGGEKASKPLHCLSSALSMLASISNHMGTRTGIIAGYERRKQDWNFQADVAKRDLKQLEQQEVSAEIRKEIARLDLRNHETQLKQTQESFDVLSSKFTNEQLYLTLARDISELYRSAFKMAFEMAKQAEGAYNYELCPNNPRLPLPGNLFNAQQKGLLAGERLFMELKKMEADYLANNKRKFELTRHVSLAMLDPQQILDLRSSGTCQIAIPEVLYDLDHPGHINRRIKSVSLSIPCVAGAYTSISANLSIADQNVKVKNMATSSAVSDSGLFELNFNDARYLPFEGADAANVWNLSLPTAMRQFDYSSINDVIMHINYTAEEGSAQDKTNAENNLITSLNQLTEGNSLASMFSLKAQYPEAWAKVGSENVSIEIKRSQLPFYLQGKTIEVEAVQGIKLKGETQDDPIILTTNGLNSSKELADKVTVDISSNANIPVSDDFMIIMKYTIS